MKKTLLTLLILVLLCPAALASDTIPWDSHMSLPSAYEQTSYKANDIAPYITFWPDLGSHGKYSEFSVDFRAEHLPRGTYLAVFNWWMESEELNRKYTSVTNDFGVAGYCGFQVHENGTHAAILTVWDKFCTDKNGRTTVYKANQVYPENGKYSARDYKGAEGSFLHTIVPYDWKEDHDYRALLQIGQNWGTHNANVAFWVCDLETNAWTLLVQYELGYDEVYLTGTCSFLENYITEYAGQVRSMILSNYRANSYDSGWVAARSGSFALGYDHPGSYNYGSTSNGFWAITTGIPGRCRRPADWKRFSVKHAESGQPY